jgi:excisionase family DNA binding protein
MSESTTASAPDLITVAEFMAALRVSRSTALRWIDAGEVQSARLPGGNYRIPRSELNRLLAGLAEPPASADTAA